MSQDQTTRMQKYDDNGNERPTRYFIGPWEDPADGPKALMSLETALDDLKSRFEVGEVGDELTYRLVEMTDAEVEKLPEL
jgi:hypothetical protein